MKTLSFQETHAMQIGDTVTFRFSGQVFDGVIAGFFQGNPELKMSSPVFKSYPRFIVYASEFISMGPATAADRVPVDTRRTVILDNDTPPLVQYIFKDKQKTSGPGTLQERAPQSFSDKVADGMAELKKAFD